MISTKNITEMEQNDNHILFADLYDKLNQNNWIETYTSKTFSEYFAGVKGRDYITHDFLNLTNGAKLTVREDIETGEAYDIR